MKIKNKNHLIEQLARNMEILEKGLVYVDSNISTIGKTKIDLLAIDADDRIVIICARDNPQTQRAKRGIHIIKESVALWDWISDLKDDYSIGVRHITGKKPAKIPPRLFLVAPSFEESLLSLAKHISIRIDIDVFTFDPVNFSPVKTAFKKIDIDKTPDPAPAHLKSLNEYHAIEVKTLREEFEKLMKIESVLGYDPKTLEDHFNNLNEDESENLKNFIEKLAKLKIIARSSKNHIFMVDEESSVISRIVFGPNNTPQIEVKSNGKDIYFDTKNFNEALKTIKL